jgi:cell wall-associated NlpC family hydrolase
MNSVPPFVPLDSVPGEIGHPTRADVIAEARTWLDTPYLHQHRAKGHGVDCAGLVIGVARELGIVARDFDVNGYPREPDGKTLLEICDRFMDRVPMADIRPGNVLVYSFAKHPAHLGIVGDYMYGGLSLIQALGTSDGKGRVIEWRILANRKGWRPVQGYALRGID